jgi:hypothetical protein
MARKYQTAVYTDDWPCARCGNRFFGTFTTRHPKYCDKCRSVIKVESARERKRKQRQSSKPVVAQRRKPAASAPIMTGEYFDFLSRNNLLHRQLFLRIA